MFLIEYVIRLLCYGAGAVLSLYVVSLLIAKKERSVSERLLLALFSAMAVWQMAHSGRLFFKVAGGDHGVMVDAVRAISERGHWVMMGIAAVTAAAALWRSRACSGAQRRFWLYFG